MGRFYKTTATPTVDYAYELPYEELFEAKKYKQGLHDKAIESLYSARDEFMELNYAPGDEGRVMQMRAEVDEMLNSYSTYPDLSYSQSTINKDIAAIVDKYDVADIQYNHDHWYSQMEKAQQYESQGLVVNNREDREFETKDGSRRDQFVESYKPVTPTNPPNKGARGAGDLSSAEIQSPYVDDVVGEILDNGTGNVGLETLQLLTDDNTGGNIIKGAITVNGGDEGTLIQMSEAQTPYYIYDKKTSTWEYNSNSPENTAEAIVQGNQLSVFSEFKDKWGTEEDKKREEYSTLDTDLQDLKSYMDDKITKASPYTKTIRLTKAQGDVLHYIGVLDKPLATYGANIDIELFKTYHNKIKNASVDVESEVTKALKGNQDYNEAVTNLNSVGILSPDSEVWNSLLEAHKNRKENLSEDDKKKAAVEAEVTKIFSKGLAGDFVPDKTGNNTTIVYDPHTEKSYMYVHGKLNFSQAEGDNIFQGNPEFFSTEQWDMPGGAGQDWIEALVDGDEQKIITREAQVKDGAGNVTDMFSVPMHKRIEMTPDMMERYDKKNGDWKSGDYLNSREARKEKYTNRLVKHGNEVVSNNYTASWDKEKLFRANKHNGLLFGEGFSDEEKLTYSENIFANENETGLLDKVSKLPDSRVKSQTISFISNLQEDLKEAAASNDLELAKDASMRIAHLETILSKESFGGNKSTQEAILKNLKDLTLWTSSVSLDTNGSASVVDPVSGDETLFIENRKVVNEPALIDYTKNEAELHGLKHVTLTSYDNLTPSTTTPIYGPYVSDKGLKGLNELNKAGFKLDVTSLFRSKVYNDAISHTGEKGSHTKGDSVDIGLGAQSEQFIQDWIRNPNKYWYIANIISEGDHYHIIFK